LAKVNVLENCAAVFTYLSLGALRGLSPAEGEAEKPEALKRGGDFPHFLVKKQWHKLII
jgi:hypothetical protein